MKKNSHLLLLFILVPMATMFAQTATVHVQDADATAIVGASVMLNAATVITDDTGIAAFTGLADGDYPYTVTADCYDEGSGSIEISGATDNIDTIVLTLLTTNDVFVNLPPPGGIGFSVPAVTVRLYNDDLSYDETVVTGGFTQFTGVPYGDYNYTLSKDCYETVEGTTSVECTPGDIDALVAEFGVLLTTNDVFVNLPPPGGIGSSVPAVTVRLYNDDLSYDETVVTGGFTQFTGVPYGDYNYTLSKDCYETVEGTTSVECTPGDIDALVAEFGVLLTTNDVFVNLPPPGGIGFSVPAVTVRLYNDDLSYDETVVTGGFTQFTGVPYGDYNYTLSKDCYETVEGTTSVECTPGDIDALVAEFGVLLTTNDVFVNLPPPGGIGFSVPAVTVRLYNDDLSYDETVVTGGFTQFTGVPYGDYNYTLSKDCYETVEGTTSVECTPGDIDALVVEFGVLATTNDVFVNLPPPGGIGFSVPAVTVRLYNDDLSYDETVVTGGFTQFTGVPYGDYNYTLSKDCYETVEGTTSVECTPGDIDALVAEFGVLATTNDVAINLLPPGGIGFSVPGVTVRLYNDDLSYDETVVTGGFTQFTGVPYGDYNYTLTKGCFETVEGTITVECTPGDIAALVAEFGVATSTTNDVFVNLTAPGGIGFPPTGVTVRLYNDALTYDETLVTGGFSQFSGVPFGVYNYTLTKDCIETVQGTTVVECTPGDIDALVAEFGVPQTTNDVAVNLLPPGGIGFSIPGVTVRLYKDDLSYDETVVTGGFTQFTGVPFGEYNYTLSKGCFETVEGTITVECTPGDIAALVAEFGVATSTTNDVFVNLPPPGGIGFSVPGVTVRLYKDDLSYDETLVTGGFTQFNEVPFGVYNYTLTKDCYETVQGTTVVECTPGDIDALIAEFGVLSTTNDVFVNLPPPGGIGFSVPEVTVRLYNDDLSYDETLVTGGFTQFMGVPYGDYNYTLSKDCYETVEGTTSVECTPGDIDALISEFGVLSMMNDVFVNLPPPGGIGFSVPAVTVRLYNDDLSYDETVVTGGFTQFMGVPYGDYNYTLSKDCYETVEGTTSVECTPGDIDALISEFGVLLTTNDVFVNLTPPGGIGIPPTEVTVRLYNDDLTYDETVVTGGVTQFSTVPYGDYNYTLSKDCYQTVEGTTSVECTPGDIDALLAEFGVDNTPDNSVTQAGMTLTANAAGVTYQWTLCDGTEIAGETNASFTPAETGEYAVVVTNDNCSSTSDCFMVTIVGTTSLNAVDLSFYPNPVQDELRIDFELNVSDVKVRIFSINGQQMLSQEFPQTEMIKLDMSMLYPGTYILDLTIKGESFKTSIIKM